MELAGGQGYREQLIKKPTPTFGRRRKAAGHRPRKSGRGSPPKSARPFNRGSTRPGTSVRIDLPPGGAFEPSLPPSGGNFFAAKASRANRCAARSHHPYLGFLFRCYVTPLGQLHRGRAFPRTLAAQGVAKRWRHTHTWIAREARIGPQTDHFAKTRISDRRKAPSNHR